MIIINNKAYYSDVDLQNMAYEEYKDSDWICEASFKLGFRIGLEVEKGKKDND